MKHKVEVGQYPKLFLNGLLLILGAGIFIGSRYLVCETFFVTGCIGLLAVSSWLVYRGHRFAWVPIAMLVLLLGIFRGSSAVSVPAHDISHFANGPAVISGKLVSDPLVRYDADGTMHTKYVVRCAEAKNKDGVHRAVGNIIVYGKAVSYDESKADGIREQDIYLGRVGDSIKVSGEIKEIHDYQNPGRIDVVMTYMAQDIRCQLIPDKYSLVLEKNGNSSISRWAGDVRADYQQKMISLMSGKDAAAIFAMLFGGYSGIDPDLLDAFTVTGIVHILSVSGSHVTLMAGTTGIIGRLLGLPRVVTAGLATFTIILYGLLAGAVIPVIRSGVMGILTLLALTLGREQDAQYIFAIAAIGILLLWPLSLFDISFQLSFGATAGLLYISPLFMELFQKKIYYFLAGSLAVTLGAQLSVLPLLAWYFNVLSVSSLVANIFITPIVEWIIVLGLMGGLAAVILPLLGKIIFVSASLLLGMVHTMARMLADMPCSQVYLPTMGPLAIIVYYLCLLACILPKKYRSATIKWLKLYGCGMTRRQRCILVVFLLVPVLAGSGYYYLKPGLLQVHFIDTKMTTLIRYKACSAGVLGIFYCKG